MATAKVAHTNNYLEIAVVAVAVAKLAINCNNCRLHISIEVPKYLSHEAHGYMDGNANGQRTRADCGTQMPIFLAFMECSSDDEMDSLQIIGTKLF